MEKTESVDEKQNSTETVNKNSIKREANQTVLVNNRVEECNCAYSWEAKEAVMALLKSDTMKIEFSKTEPLRLELKKPSPEDRGFNLRVVTKIRIGITLNVQALIDNGAFRTVLGNIGLAIAERYKVNLILANGTAVETADGTVRTVKTA